MATRWDAIANGSIRIPANEHLGLRIDQTSAQESVSFTWTVPAEYCNSAGNLQGGMLAALADAALGGAAAARLSADEYPALAEMKISIFRPAPAGATITATGRVLKTGKRVLFVEAEVRDVSGTLIAKASGTEIPADA